MDDLNNSTSALRRTLRACRKAIPEEQRQKASADIARHAVVWLDRVLGDVSGLRIGFFLSLSEEADTAPLLALLRDARAEIYLPFVHARDAALHWQPYNTDTVLDRDALDIAAPPDNEVTRIAGMALDAVVTPLVGWDRSGYRIGMGGGFYDRTFAAKIPGIAPFLLGYAYACQEVVPGIAPQPWDIRLDGIVSEHEILFFTGAEYAKKS